MDYILCYQNLVIGINLTTQMRKGLNFYYKTNGITSLKKHVDVDHSFIAQMFEEEMNSLLRRIKKRQSSKKRTNPFKGLIFENLYVNDMF